MIQETSKCPPNTEINRQLSQQQKPQLGTKTRTSQVLNLVISKYNIILNRSSVIIISYGTECCHNAPDYISDKLSVVVLKKQKAVLFNCQRSKVNACKLYYRGLGYLPRLRLQTDHPKKCPRSPLGPFQSFRHPK